MFGRSSEQVAQFVYADLSFEEVIDIVRAAEELGADRIIIQTYTKEHKNAIGGTEGIGVYKRVLVEIEQYKEEEDSESQDQ